MCVVMKLFIGPVCTCVRICTCVDGLLYGVTGPTGVLLPQGFTIDLVEDERYSVDLIATWSPDDKVIIINIMSQVQFQFGDQELNTIAAITVNGVKNRNHALTQ